MSSETTARHAYRLLALSDAEARRLTAVLPTFRIRAHWRDPHVFAASLPLLGPEDCDHARRAAAMLHPARAGHDLFASVVTDADTFIVGVPDFIVDLVRDLGCGVTFSCTLVAPPDDGDP